jgi:hypothetical protein
MHLKKYTQRKKKDRRAALLYLYTTVLGVMLRIYVFKDSRCFLDYRRDT